MYFTQTVFRETVISTGGKSLNKVAELIQKVA